MSVKELKDLLEHLEDTREIVIDPAGAPAASRTTGRVELMAVWSAARTEASRALEEWRRAPGSRAYAVYRAAEDRADAAQDALTA